MADLVSRDSLMEKIRSRMHYLELKGNRATETNDYVAQLGYDMGYKVWREMLSLFDTEPAKAYLGRHPDGSVYIEECKKYEVD